MTEKDLSEAREYVERSIDDQVKLGYARPPKPVIDRAVTKAAHAIRTLNTLNHAGSRK
jgi:hypothetical protein